MRSGPRGLGAERSAAVRSLGSLASGTIFTMNMPPASGVNAPPAVPGSNSGTTLLVALATPDIGERLSRNPGTFQKNVK
jgi:hypothetical protein